MSLRRSMAWVALSQALFFLVQFGGSVVIARLLTPYELGVYAVALAIVGMISTLQAFGLSAFVVREPELTHSLRASVFTVNAALCLVLSVAIASASILGGVLLRERGVSSVMLELAILPILDILQFLPSAGLEREGDFKRLALVGSGKTLVSQITTVIAAFLGYSYHSMAYGQIAASVLGVLAFNMVGRRHVSVSFSLSEWRRIVSFGWQMIIVSGVNAITTRLSETVLGRLAGLSALGLYSRASNLNNLAWENIHLVIGRVVFVNLAERKRAGEDLRSAYMACIEILTALLWPTFIGLAIVSGPFILAVYGARWVPAAHPLAMLAIAAALLVSISMTWELFVITGETGRQAGLEVVRAAVSFGLFVGGALGGLTLAAAARIGDAIFSIFLYRPHLDRMTSTRTRDFWPIYRRSASLTGIAVAPAAALMAYNHWSERTSLASLFFAIVIGVLLWSLTLVWLDHPLAREAKRLGQRLGRKARPTAPSMADV